MKTTRTVIEPPKGFSFHFSELWQYRELFYFFSWRDIKVKYKQTYLGILWALIQPLALMLLFTLVFARHFSSTTGSINYNVFVLSGLILWTLFYNATSHAAESIVQQAGMIKKIYFPRLIIIGSAMLTAFFDFLIAFVLFLVFCLAVNQTISWKAIFYFPAGVVVVMLSSFGIGTLLSSLNVKFRDFRYALPFLLQFLFFASQVVYNISSLKQGWAKPLLSLNPVNSAIELFRMGLTNKGDSTVIIVGVLSAVLLSILGIFYFRKTEAYFADLA
ncbi:MAG: ABC transporter permease [Gammaproteobacteria bacterium]|nr:MAG: ABC transporter permease [Gammaproteobacteria bacterium]